MSTTSQLEQSKARTMLANMSAFFYTHWKISIAVFGALLLAGALSYTTFLKREGFPSIQFPLTVVSGTYLADKNEIDNLITKPFSEALSSEDTIDSVSATAGDNFFSLVVFFDSDVKPDEGAALVEQKAQEADLPEQAQINFTSVDPAAYLNEYDLIATIYSTDPSQSVEGLQTQAAVIANQLTDNSTIESAAVKPLVEDAQNPFTGETVTRQTAFNQIGVRDDSNELQFYSAIPVGVNKVDEADILELSAAVEDVFMALDRTELTESTQVAIGAEQADSIETQISSLEMNLLTGILAVVAVSLLLISWRASIITSIFMVSVVLVSTLVLLLVGSTLNTITLFGLILALGLFVDDATIIVEAIDASRSNNKGSALKLLRLAIARVALASFAGTLTTILVFAPLAFVGGILGEFIRILPITVIISLATSLILSLTLIPFLARFTILTKKNLANKRSVNPILAFERYAAHGLAGSIRWLSERSTKGYVVAGAAVFFSFIMIGAAGLAAQKTEFNIFPSSKDADQLIITLDFAPGTSIDEAEEISSNVNQIVKNVGGEEVEKVVYGGFTLPNERQADLVVELTPFTERTVTSVDITQELEAELALVDARATVRQIDAGPPEENYPFKVQVYGEDQAATLNLAKEIQTFLTANVFERMNGEQFSVNDTIINGSDVILRNEGRRLIEVGAGFEDSDTSALVTAAQAAVEEEFSEEYLNSQGFESDTLGFDFGQESQNAESFNSLILVFPIALLAMFVVLGLQFRSIVQPLLIFMAIPFSLFGVFSGLILTDNPLSFFSMVGLIGLIGIAVNNTILLVDYANQERREGRGIIDSIATASERRFRPLLATTLTTVVALLPLALSDPFWESLAYTIIFGLLSSTLLVIVSFPYYYIGIEKIRELSKALFVKLKDRKV